MGLLFNTPGTNQIVNRLNQRYDDSPGGGLQAHRGDAVVYLNFGGYPTLWDVASQLGLYPGAAGSHVATRWHCFLDYIDPMPNPGGGTIGSILRNDIAGACANLNCEAIEFFAVPDTVVHL